MPYPLFRSKLKPVARFRATLAVFTGKFCMRILRVFGRGATALPGKVALWLWPRLLIDLTAERSVFLVTGTNGKTTTVRVLVTILQEQGRIVITNPSGANLDTGLTSILIANKQKLVAENENLALVFEIDEAFFGKLAADLRPEICVVTNFFRDQLDRFGELQHIRDLIAGGLRQAGAKTILCADDSLCASLGREPGIDSLYFGLGKSAMRAALADSNFESAFCVICGEKYNYGARAYGHLGDFHCPGCGFTRPEPDLEFLPLRPDEKSLPLQLSWHAEQGKIVLPIPGIHNGYNAAGALLAALAAGLPFAASVAALGQVKAAFGRMERFTAEDREVCLILVKNPAGMDRALEFVSLAGDVGGVMFLLNANDPDGRDISWIWDAHFEQYLPGGRIAVSGERCHDMALRLFYAGKKPEELISDLDNLQLYDLMLAACPPGRCLYVLPNYTAMLDLRAALSRRYRLPAFWS